MNAQSIKAGSLVRIATDAQSNFWPDMHAPRKFRVWRMYANGECMIETVNGARGMRTRVKVAELERI